MMGGIPVDTDSIKNKDSLQLQQIIIYLKSEIVKYQNEISTLKKMDYYSMVNSLEQEIVQLEKEKKALLMEQRKMKQTFEKELNELHENIQVRENQRIKLIGSIESLVKVKDNLQKENSNLKEIIKGSNISERPSNISNDYLKSIENIENLLRPFIKKNSTQLASINEALENQQQLIMEIKHIDEKIDGLLKENEKQLQTNPSSPVENNEDSSDTRLYLENQLQKLVVQALYFEAQLEEKLKALDDFDEELLFISKEIDQHKKDKS